MHRPLGRSFCLSCDVYIYLELACHGEQNGAQSFNLQARIAELWRLKPRKVTKKIVQQSVSLIYVERVFLEVAKNDTIFGSN